MKQGFSLVEMIISVAIFAMISIGLIALVSAIFSSNTRAGTLLSDNGQAMKVAFTIMRELRNAQTSTQGGYPLATANSQQIIFYSDTGATVDRINYFIQNGALKKGVTVPTGSPLIYNLGNEVVTTVQNNLGNEANPLFFYYDDTYDGVNGSPLTQPVNLTQVRFIRINLTVYNKGGVQNTNTYSVTAGGTIRSLKSNLGN